MLKTLTSRRLHKNWVPAKPLYWIPKFFLASGVRLALHKSANFRGARQRMKAPATLGLLIIALSGYAANAAPFSPSDYSDVDVISVKPRNPDTKPFVMAILTKEQQQRISAAAFKKGVFVAAGQSR
jgi:hypothetical protein